MAVIGFNTRELEAMEEAFRKMTNNSSLLRKCTVRLSQRMLRSAKMRSPVKTGELRRNWNITCERKGRGYVITLSNPKKYAPYVEYGHRTRNHTVIRPNRATLILLPGLICTSGAIKSTIFCRFSVASFASVALSASE